jgi:nicotinamide-nucleotide amidase
MTATPPAPTVRILSTGSELLQGLYADTNAQRIARQFYEWGFAVVGAGAVPDDRPLIAEALEFAARRADLVVMTGGLGPTEDDVNRDVIAALYGVALAEDATAVDMMKDRFQRRGIPMPARNMVQALLPVGCTPLYNHWGTAPGFVLPGRAGLATLMALPGPSREWMPMLAAAREPVLLPLFPPVGARLLHCFHLSAMPESLANEVLGDLFHRTDGTQLTILASAGHLRLRLVATGPDEAAARAQLEATAAEIRARLGAGAIYAEHGDTTTVAEAVLDLLRAGGHTLALAESCTGGTIARAITDVPGASRVFLAGWITYSNAAKVRELGVPAELIAAHGAVSGEVARAMAEGALARSGASVALSVTGIAGPDGGTAEKPVGTVWFGLARDGESLAVRRQLPGNRDFIRDYAMQQGLELLRRWHLGVPLEPMVLGTGAVNRV